MYPRLDFFIYGLFYWGFFLVSLLFSIVIFFKRNKLTGFLQFILSIVSPIWAFLFSLQRDYLYPGLEKNEFYYMFKQVIHLNLEAIFITLLYILLFALFLYNILVLKRNK